MHQAPGLISALMISASRKDIVLRVGTLRYLIRTLAKTKLPLTQTPCILTFSLKGSAIEKVDVSFVSVGPYNNWILYETTLWPWVMKSRESLDYAVHLRHKGKSCFLCLEL